GYHIREAGSTAVQELAFTLADGFAYVEAALERGLDIDDFAPRLSFFFNSHNNFFEEVCKYRAARRIWARHMKNRYGAKKPESMRLRFHTQTAGVSLAAQEPENNIARVTLQGLASVLGGTQSLHTNSFDEALCLPTENAVKIALRTQQIIAHESGVTDTGLSVAFSLHTIYGIEATDTRALGEIGKEGVSIDNLKDMETLFDGIDLSKISTSMTINGPASILLALYIVTAEKQGHTPDQLRGTIQNDILKEYIAQKSWIFPPEPSMRIII
ncbi:unnamed protein product, partial [marine sediment metagenome]